MTFWFTQQVVSAIFKRYLAIFRPLFFISEGALKFKTYESRPVSHYNKLSKICSPNKELASLLWTKFVLVLGRNSTRGWRRGLDVGWWSDLRMEVHGMTWEWRFVIWPENGGEVWMEVHDLTWEWRFVIWPKNGGSWSDLRMEARLWMEVPSSCSYSAVSLEPRLDLRRLFK